MSDIGCKQFETKRKMRDRVSIRRPLAEKGLETMSAHYVRQSFKPHAHDEYVIGVIAGGVHSVWCRGEHHLVDEGTVVTMHPGDVHYGGPEGDEGWLQHMLYISEAHMSQMICDVADTDLQLLPDFYQTFHKKPALAKSFEQFHQILHMSELTLAREVALDSLIRLIMGELTPHIVKAQPSVHYPEGRIDEVVGLLHERVKEDVTLDELCHVSGLRRRQTIEAFKKRTGLPPHAYHVIEKIKAVKKMLRDGVSATEASALAGFSDQSHMTRHFVAVVGMTPGTYARA